MTNRLKAGVVVSLRVNPKDCMSVVDVMGRTGLISPGMSFSAMCSLTLSSLLETMRQQGHLPDRSGFEFSELVGPYMTGKNTKRIAAAKAIEQVGSDFSAPTLPTQKAARNNHTSEQDGYSLRMPEAKLVPTLEHRQAARRLTELIQKKDLADDTGSGVVWSVGDQQEYDECYKVVYPDG